MTNPSTMRAIWVEQIGEPETMQLRELPIPPLKPGFVRLKVDAVGINFADVLAVQGKYLTPTQTPLIPGMEFAGTVDAVGEGVSGFTVGQAVACLGGRGGLAEYATVPAQTLVPVPEGLNSAEAAAFPVSYYTAYITLLTLGHAQPGETVLVQGAAGALGTALIQVARALDLNVIALASTEDKLKIASDLGAHVTLLSERSDIVDAVKEATGGKGVNLLVEITGGEMVQKSLRMMANRGRVLIVGAASGEDGRVSSTALMKKNLSVTGVWLTSMMGEPGVIEDAVAFFTPLLKSGQIRPQVGNTYSLEQSATAFRDILGRKTTGKVVIEPQR
ncbi:NADPH:quinone oxidoreductase family protein [Deinococcus sp. KNUC1210]|uniref:NADPH:quinone oxidoreductase family protein n=1 Tax=Deinococcus sp. KNUC1210 TaxID=2917691 RepID=UPI001EEFB066|nr:NADPH:quinone oxidoreductase family protein [Deinococcus sp. KNUC1210]ULH15159.1 NADPH:quinone oxidoreductase family protein [Deinococcus sp. KNUC1210]